jgi:hypothetical protein
MEIFLESWNNRSKSSFSQLTSKLVVAPSFSIKGGLVSSLMIERVYPLRFVRLYILTILFSEKNGLIIRFFCLLFVWFDSKGALCAAF